MTSASRIERNETSMPSIAITPIRNQIFHATLVAIGPERRYVKMCLIFIVLSTLTWFREEVNMSVLFFASSYRRAWLRRLDTRS
jgi:hypothetical protein